MMTTNHIDRLPEWARAFLDGAIDVTQADLRISGLMIGGSATTGAMDEYSDLDLVVVCQPEHQASLLRTMPDLAARLGSLLACFTGEHVGEPRLLIALFGPPLLHVDLKVVTDGELDQRVEDGLIVWQRDSSLTEALRRAEAVWPRPDPQWIEDRFWIWVHYGAAKVGRGELFECLDVLAFLRSVVFGPLLALSCGQRPQGVRRLEQFAPGAVAAVEATVGDHTTSGCLAALHAAVDLYRLLRGKLPGIVHHASAETASVAYLADVETRLAARPSTR